MANLASSIPDSLRLGCMQSTIRTNRFRLVPQGSQTVSQNGTVRVRLPERSLVRLSSLSAYFNFNIFGISTDAANYNNALIPASYKPFRSVRFLVNGQSASGHLAQNYDVIYEALVQSSTDDRWAYSRLAQGYKELVQYSDDSSTGVTAATQAANALIIAAALPAPAANAPNKTQYMFAEDFLGLPRCNGKAGQNGGVIDTSLFGVVEVEFILNDASILTAWGATNAAVNLIPNINWNMTEFRVECDVITSVSPAYVELMALKLSDPAPIKMAFQNYVQTVSTASGNNRLQVNSQCVDMIMVLPMASTWNTLVPIGPSSSLDGAGNAYGALTVGSFYPVQPVHYQFNSGLTVATEGNLRLQIVVGSETYPKTVISHALDVFDINTNSFFHGSTSNKNQFYYGLIAGAASATGPAYSRALALASSCIHAQSFSLQSEGWASSVLTGLDTSSQNVDIIVQSQNFPNLANGVQMLVALTTSQLVYDPQTASVSIVP